MLLFPPFYAKLPTRAIENLGYGLIFRPPVFELRFPNRGDLTGTVDIGLLYCAMARRFDGGPHLISSL